MGAVGADRRRGLSAAASLPQPAIDQLVTAKAAKEPATQERLAQDAAIAIGSTPAERAKVKPD